MADRNQDTLLAVLICNAVIRVEHLATDKRDPNSPSFSYPSLPVVDPNGVV
jgi:hypothetical protein